MTHISPDEVDYTLEQDLELINQPLVVNVSAVDDDVYRGNRTLNLTLFQTNTSDNNVTHDWGLVSHTVVIFIKDNDSKYQKSYWK